MMIPVDLNNFREMIQGSELLEVELFNEFISTSEQLVKELSQCFADDDAWYSTAHTLKGLCMNLGAEQLMYLCLIAHMRNNSPIEEKQAMIVLIRAEFERVKEYLKNQMNG